MSKSFSRLKPRDIPGLVDQAFRLYRRNFLLYLAIAAVVDVPIQIAIRALEIAVIGTQSGLINAALGGDLSGFQAGRSQTFVSLALFNLANYTLSALRFAALTLPLGAMTVAVINTLEDKPISFGSAYKEALSRRSIFGMAIVLFLVAASIFMPSALSSLGTLAVGSSGATAVVCLGLTLGIALLIYGIRYFVIYQVAVPALVTEGLSTREATRRSSRLVKGSWWRSAGLLILVSIISLVVSAGPAALVTALVGVFIRFDATLSQVVATAVSGVTTVLFLPVELLAITLYYFDLRVRKEGLDIEAALNEIYPYPQQQDGQVPAYQYGAAGTPTGGAVAGQPSLWAPAQAPVLGQQAERPAQGDVDVAQEPWAPPVEPREEGAH